MMNYKTIKMARMALNWTRQDLQKASGVGLTTLQRMETSKDLFESAQLKNIKAVQMALEEAGIEFIGEDGVRLKEKGG